VKGIFSSSFSFFTGSDKKEAPKPAASPKDNQVPYPAKSYKH
jgi:hypothetical protein